MRYLGILAVASIVVLGLGAPTVAQATFVGPLIAYSSSEVDRVIVDDLGNNTTRDYPARGLPVWSPDGTRLALVDESTGELIVIEIATGRLITAATDVPRVFGSTPGIDWASATEVAVPMGDKLLAIAADGSGGVRSILDDPGYVIAGVDMSPDHSRFVLVDCAIEEGGFCSSSVWNTASGSYIEGIGEGAGWDWSPDSSRLAFSGIGVDVDVLDVLTVQTTKIYQTPSETNVGGLVYHPDGTSVAFGLQSFGDPEAVQILSASSTSCCAAQVLPVGGRGYPRSFSPDGTLLAFGDSSSEFSLVVTEVGEGPIALPGGGGVGGLFAPVTPAPPPSPSAPPTDVEGVTRLSGPTRIQTAVAVSQDAWPDGGAFSATMIRADDFADALAATPLAVYGLGPLLLSARDGLHPDTAAELQRALPPGSQVNVIGGIAALGNQVQADIAALGFEAIRYGGANRVETAQAVAIRAADFIAGDVPPRVWVIEGGSFPEGIVAGNAAARSSGVVLIGQDGTRFAAERYPDAEIIQVGTWEAGPGVDRTLEAGDPYELSVAVARAFPADRGYALASGEDFPDGLSGGTHAASGIRALLLTRRDELPLPVDQLLGDAGVTEIVVYGGIAAISQAVAAQAVTLSESPPDSPTPDPQMDQARMIPGQRTYLYDECQQPPSSPLIPTDATCVTVLPVDLDGDGTGPDQMDRVLMYTQPLDEFENRLTIAGYSTASGPLAPLTTTVGNGGYAIECITTLTADPGVELMITRFGGANTVHGIIVEPRAGAMRALTGGLGGPSSEFGWFDGGGARFGGSYRIEGKTFVETQYDDETGTPYGWSRDSYTFTEGAAALIGSESGQTADTSPYSGPGCPGGSGTFRP